jgi:hypothetical protein
VDGHVPLDTGKVIQFRRRERALMRHRGADDNVSMRRLPIVLALIFCTSTPALAAHRPGGLDAPLRGIAQVTLLRFPEWLLMAPFRLFSHHTAAAPAGTPVTRDAGWTRMGFALQEPGRGVCLAIDGKAELGRIEILFDDGELQQVDAGAGHVYSRGVYEVAAFSQERRVVLVRLESRARSTTAHVQALLTRDDSER